MSIRPVFCWENEKIKTKTAGNWIQFSKIVFFCWWYRLIIDTLGCYLFSSILNEMHNWGFPPHLTAHWLVQQLVPPIVTSGCVSSLKVPSMHFSRRRRLMRNVLCLGVNWLQQFENFLISLLVRPPNVANVSNVSKKKFQLSQWDVRWGETQVTDWKNKFVRTQLWR